MLEKKKEKRKENVQIKKEKKEMDEELAKNIMKSYIFHFLMGFHFISGVLIPFFITWGKLSFFEITLLQSYFTIMVFIFEVPCGAIADYLSRKFSLFLGCVVSAFAVLIYSSAPNIILFMIGEGFFGLGFSLLSGSDEALIFDTLRKIERESEMSQITARNRSFSTAGMMISAPFGSIIALFFPLNFVMTFMFFPFVIAALISLTLKEPDCESEKKTMIYLKIVKAGFIKLKTSRPLRLLAFDLIVIELLAFFMIWAYQLHLGNLSVPIVYFGFVGALLTCSEIIFMNLAPKLMKHSKSKKLALIIYTLIPGVAYLLIAFTTSVLISITLIVIIIGFGFSRNVIFIDGINKEIDSKSRATVLSTISMIKNLLKAVLYPIIGYLVEFNLNFAFITLGITIVLFALFSRIKNEHL